MTVRRVGVVPVFVLASAVSAAAQTLTFHRDDRSSATSARGIASADFNRDGWIDLVTAHHDPDGVAVLLNRGAAGGYTPSFIALSGGPFDVVTGDLNNDGLSDIAVANADANSVNVLFGRAEGGFAPSVDLPGANPRGLAIADVDLDGNFDIVFTEFAASRATIYWGTGAGTFSSRAPAVLSTVANPQGVAVGDFNIDGRPDVVTVATGGFNMGVTIHFADGAPGAFTRWSIQGTQQQNVVTVGDFDKDGRPDIVAAGSNTSNVTTLMNTRAGWSIRAFPAGGASPRGIGAADVNRDGALDIVLAARGTSTIVILAGTGDGRFAAPEAVPAGTGARAVTTGDFNHDGRIDVASANEYAASATVLSNSTAFPQAAFKFRRQRLGPGDDNSSGGRHVAIADFDRDGLLDAVNQDGVHVRFGNGRDLALGTAIGALDLVALDANRDGHADIVVVTQGLSISGPSRLEVFLGDGNGNFPGRRTVATSLHASIIDTADFNLDGRTDIVVVGQTEWSGPIRIHLLSGQADGGFTLAANYAADEFPFTINVGDVDRDGDPDIVTAGNGGTRTARVVTRLNERNWSLSAPRETEAPGLAGISESDLGDLNHDGFLDVAVEGSAPDWRSRLDLAVMLGGPSGFGAPSYLEVEEFALGALIADLTMDGHADVMTHNGYFYKGRGDGTFDVAERFAFYDPGLEIADFNRDGLPDLVGAENKGTIELILNQRGTDNAPPTVRVTTNSGLFLPYSGQFGDGGSQNEIWAQGDDLDLHQLRYKFRDAQGEFDQGTFPFFWPRYLMEPGRHEIFVEVRDGRGGTATGSIVITILPEKEIVLQVGNAGWDTTARGTWSAIDDPSAAGGKALHDVNAGQPKVTVPSASPANSVDVGFAADTTQTYKLWVRLKADGNSWSNDSIWLQFTNAVDSAGRSIAPGTTAGIEVNLEECSGCGVSGWGWRDEAWGQRDLVGTLTVRFTQSGWQRLRIQTREDGVSVDQVVLSAETYRTTRPGATKNDTRILPPSSYW
jgi:hypothetical protein